LPVRPSSISGTSLTATELKTLAMNRDTGSF
jgi:hypothetical protein